MLLSENKVTGFAFALLILILFAALFGPLCWCRMIRSPANTGGGIEAAESAAHWFGTDAARPRHLLAASSSQRGSTLFIAVASVVLRRS